MQEPLTDLFPGVGDGPGQDEQAFQQVRERVQALITAARGLSDTCADLADALRPVPGHAPEDPLVAAFGRLRAERTAALLDEAASAARGTLGLLHSAYGALDRTVTPPSPRSGATTWPDAFVEVRPRAFTVEDEAGSAVEVRSPWGPLPGAAVTNDTQFEEGGLRPEVTDLPAGDDSADGLRAFAIEPVDSPADAAAEAASPLPATAVVPEPADPEPATDPGPTSPDPAATGRAEAAPRAAEAGQGGLPDTATTDAGEPADLGRPGAGAEGPDAEGDATGGGPADDEAAGRTTEAGSDGPEVASGLDPAVAGAGAEPAGTGPDDESAKGDTLTRESPTDDPDRYGPEDVDLEGLRGWATSAPGLPAQSRARPPATGPTPAEPDTAPADNALPDTAPADNALPDTALPVGPPAPSDPASPADDRTDTRLQTPPPAEPANSGPKNADPADFGPGDAGPADPGPADPGPADPSLVDAGLVDAGLVDSGLVDSGLVGRGQSGQGDPERTDTGLAAGGVAAPGEPDAEGPEVELADGTSVEDTDEDDPARITSAALAGWIVVDPDVADDPGRPIRPDAVVPTAPVFAAATAPDRLDARIPSGDHHADPHLGAPAVSHLGGNAGTPFGRNADSRPGDNADSRPGDNADSGLGGNAVSHLGRHPAGRADEDDDARPDARPGDRDDRRPGGGPGDGDPELSGDQSGLDMLHASTPGGDDRPAGPDMLHARTSAGADPGDPADRPGVHLLDAGVPFGPEEVGPAGAGPDAERSPFAAPPLGGPEHARPDWHGDTVSAEPRSLSLVPPVPEGPETIPPTWSDDRMPVPADPWAAGPAPATDPWRDPMGGADLSGAATFARVERPMWTAEPVPGSSVAGDGVAVYPIGVPAEAVDPVPAVPMDEPAAAVISRQVEAARRHLQAALVVANGPSAPQRLGALLTAVEQVLTAVTDLARETRGVLESGLAERTFPGEARFLCSPPWDGTQLVGRDPYGDDAASPAGLAKLLRALGYEARSNTSSAGVAGVQVRAGRYQMHVALVEPAGGGRQRWSGALEWVDGTGASRTWAETLGPVELEDEELARRVDELLRRSLGG